MNKVGQALETVFDVVKELTDTGRFRASPEMVQKRMKVCHMCPHLKGNKCEACGCFMNLKTELQATRCPYGYWEEKIMEETMLGEMSPIFSPVACCQG